MGALTVYNPDVQRVTVIGAGLAGCEAAHQLVERGVPVRLFEMRPRVMTAAHATADFAELVCSNSFKGTDVSHASGLIKEELRRLGSLVITTALATRVPAGTALAVDRDAFSRMITEDLMSSPLVGFVNEPVTTLAGLDKPVIVATGPDTYQPLFDEVASLVGVDHRYFYDATTPILRADSLDKSALVEAGRRDKGGGYLNAFLEEPAYMDFRDAILSAERVPVHADGNLVFFEGCLPIEELAERGVDTMRFGPLKPVGFEPENGRMPYAVVQLRQDDALASAYALVGFQTRLTFGEQERVFRLIPGLGKAQFIRFGRMHRNNYFDAPRILNPDLSLRANPEVFLAGQITGLEGYVAAAATGLVAGVSAARRILGEPPADFPRESCVGAALEWMTNPSNAEYRPTAFTFAMFLHAAADMRGHKRRALIREKWSVCIDELVAELTEA